jgi:putative peptidoglycan binding protein
MINHLDALYMDRPTLNIGDIGSLVKQVQRYLEIDADGMFGPQTEEAVMFFQGRNGLDVDGVIGAATWAALEANYYMPPYPPAPPPCLDNETVHAICTVARNSPISIYSWRDRGVAPSGYINGMAVAFATDYLRWINEDPIMDFMAHANTGDDDKDALSWYNSDFAELGMHNTKDGVDTLRHLYVLMLGLGMRESSGRHCEGRDMSADNVSSETAEAGLFQMSWNAANSNTDMVVLQDSYSLAAPEQGYMDIFSVNVECDASDWGCYGTGRGLAYQEMAKAFPLFACETAALGLRVLRQHWGPINRKEVEILSEADDMFQEVQDIIVGVQV